MRLLFIHPTHPSTPHISAVRVWRFAQELAKLGHSVAVLCANREDGQRDPKTDIDHHHWAVPFVLSCDRGGPGWLNTARLPHVVRRTVTALRMLYRGGNLGTWADSVVAAARELKGRFQPDLIWTTFGFMEALVAARRAAKVLGCPWVLDVKDNWEHYVPCGLRRLMSLRTSGWSWLTANAAFTQTIAGRWQRRAATVVYSGVDDAFFVDDAAARREADLLAINLVGGLYFEDRLEEFLVGVKTWAQGLTAEERDRARLRYLGVDTEMFDRSAAKVGVGIPYEVLGYRPVVEMASICKLATVNAYIANPVTFHHKLLELLATGKPVLAFPDEGHEARRLAVEVGGSLRTPGSALAVAEELARIHDRSQSGCGPAPDPTALRTYSWSTQAKVLEQTFQRVILGRGRTHD